MHSSVLADRAVFAIAGEDARDFLQGLITKDVRKIVPGALAFAALLSPQGRFMFDFFITGQEGKFLIETEKSGMHNLVKRLTMYRLRSKVQFEECADMQVTAAWGEGSVQPPEGSLVYTDPRLPELGKRIWSRGAQITENNGDYDAHRIALGVPEGSKDLVFDRSILLEYGYDELHGVDFDKGCYVGQEVTARSKHRATLRKFIHHVQAQMPLPAKGTPILAGEREAGVITGSHGNQGLAHLKVEEVQRALATSTPLAAAKEPVTATLPLWCKTAFEAA